jgi:uncharacterized protein (TIGR03067 family)
MPLLPSLSCVLLAAGLVPAPGGDAGRLIGQLGSPDFAEREAATRRLEEAGEGVLAALRKAAGDSDDAEIRRRARRLVERIGNRDYQRLQGTWEPVSAGGPRLTVRRSQFILGTGDPLAFTFTLDPSASPRGLDLLHHGGLVLPCIYALKGDRLEVCLPLHDERRRPKTFPADNQGTFALLKFKRARAGAR